MKTLGVNWIEQSNLTKKERADVYSKVEDISILDKAMHFFTPEEVLHSGYLLPIIMSDTPEKVDLNGFEMSICYFAKGNDFFEPIEQDVFLIGCVGTDSEIETALKAKVSGNVKEQSEVVKIAQKYSHLLAQKPVLYKLELLPLFRTNTSTWNFGNVEIKANKDGGYVSNGSVYTSLELAFKSEVSVSEYCEIQNDENLRKWLDESTLTNIEKLQFESSLALNLKGYGIKDSNAFVHLTEMLTAEEAFTCRLAVLLVCANFPHEVKSPTYVKDLNAVELIALYSILKAKDASSEYGFKHVLLMLAIGDKEKVALGKKLLNYKTKGKAFLDTFTYACLEAEKIHERLIREKLQSNHDLGLIGKLYCLPGSYVNDAELVKFEFTLKNRETYTIGDHIVTKACHEWHVVTINPAINEVSTELQNPTLFSSLQHMLAFTKLTYKDLINKKNTRTEQRNALDEIMRLHQTNIDDDEMESFKEFSIFGSRLDLAIEHAKADAARRAEAIIKKTEQLETKVRSIIEYVMDTGDLSKISSDMTSFYPDITESLYLHFYKEPLPSYEVKPFIKQSRSRVNLRFPQSTKSDAKRGPHFIQLN